jgi:hypothetical protein
MSFRKRLQRLERTISAGPCPACAGQGDSVVVVSVKQQADGPETAHPAGLCAVCGQGPELIIELLDGAVEGTTTPNARGGNGA